MIKTITSAEEMKNELSEGNMVRIQNSISIDSRYYRYNNTSKELQYSDDNGLKWAKSNLTLEYLIADIQNNKYVSKKQLYV